MFAFIKLIRQEEREIPTKKIWNWWATVAVRFQKITSKTQATWSPSRNLCPCRRLKQTTKTTKLLTSDSDCSTSGCYGESSTGTDIDLEQNVIFGESWTDEEARKNKLHEIKPVKRTIKNHAASKTPPVQFRKQIVSV